MEKTYLDWNFPNWITVVLMAAIGVALVGAAASFVRQYLPGAAGTIDGTS